MPNGITSTFDYDNMSRLKRLKHQSSTATLFDNQYTYNTASQISQITDLTNTRVFGYDLVDRLTSVHTNGTQTESYTFDDVGNRTASHLSGSYGYQSGKFNQLASTATASYQFDANGNTIQKSEGKDFWRYTWDYENRLVEASTRKEKARYKYDALGRRVERNLRHSKERTRFTHDGLDVVMDDDADTGITKYQNGLGIDDKLKLSNGGTASYFLGDHLGSTLGLANSSASVTSSNSYDSFGNSTGNLVSRYQFTGREFDNFSGLQFSRARFYDPKLGRFISEDPIGFRGGDVNLYGYVRNQPAMFRDPTGRFIPIIVAGGAAVAILILSSPSPVNAPGPGDPVYFPDNPILVNAAGGAACTYLVGRFVSPFLSRLLAGAGDDIIQIGISQGPRIGRLPGQTVDPVTGAPVGRFVGDPAGNVMIEPAAGSTVPGRNPVDTHTLYPNGSNYQRLNPAGHPNNPTPHGHGHLPGTGPGMKGQGPSLDVNGNVVPWNSPAAHWPIEK